MEDTVVVINSDSEEDEANICIKNAELIWKKRLRQNANTIIFHHLSSDYKLAFPYEKFKNFYIELKKTLSQITSESTRSFIWQKLIQWLIAMKLSYSKIVDLKYDKRYNFILINFIAEYINYKCKLNLHINDDYEIQKQVNHILCILGIMFNGDLSYIVLTLLKIKVTREYTNILKPIFITILSDKYDHKKSKNLISYLPLVFAFKQFKKLALCKKDREAINEIAVGKSFQCTGKCAPVNGECTGKCTKIQEGILPHFVPTIDDDNNRSFLAVSDLIGHAIKRKFGTKILLINKSLDLDEAIDTYFIQYERYINGFDPSTLCRSKDLLSLHDNVENTNKFDNMHTASRLQHQQQPLLLGKQQQQQHLSNVRDINTNLSNINKKNNINRLLYNKSLNIKTISNKKNIRKNNQNCDRNITADIIEIDITDNSSEDNDDDNINNLTGITTKKQLKQSVPYKKSQQYKSKKICRNNNTGNLFKNNNNSLANVETILLSSDEDDNNIEYIRRDKFFNSNNDNNISRSNSRNSSSIPSESENSISENPTENIKINSKKSLKLNDNLISPLSPPLISPLPSIQQLNITNNNNSNNHFSDHNSLTSDGSSATVNIKKLKKQNCITGEVSSTTLLDCTTISNENDIAFASTSAVEVHSASANYKTIENIREVGNIIKVNSPNVLSNQFKHRIGIGNNSIANNKSLNYSDISSDDDDDDTNEFSITRNLYSRNIPKKYIREIEKAISSTSEINNTKIICSSSSRNNIGINTITESSQNENCENSFFINPNNGIPKQTPQKERIQFSFMNKTNNKNKNEQVLSKSNESNNSSDNKINKNTVNCLALVPYSSVSSSNFNKSNNLDDFPGSNILAKNSNTAFNKEIINNGLDNNKTNDNNKIVLTENNGTSMQYNECQPNNELTYEKFENSNILVQKGEVKIATNEAIKEINLEDKPTETVSVKNLNYQTKYSEKKVEEQSLDISKNIDFDKVDKNKSEENVEKLFERKAIEIYDKSKILNKNLTGEIGLCNENSKNFNSEKVIKHIEKSSIDKNCSDETETFVKTVKERNVNENMPILFRPTTSPVYHTDISTNTVDKSLQPLPIPETQDLILNKVSLQFNNSKSQISNVLLHKASTIKSSENKICRPVKTYSNKLIEKMKPKIISVMQKDNTDMIAENEPKTMTVINEKIDVSKDISPTKIIEISEPPTTTLIKKKTVEQTECVPKIMTITKDIVNVLPEREPKITAVINENSDMRTKCETNSSAVSKGISPAKIIEISEPQTTIVIKEKTDEHSETKDNIDVLREYKPKTVMTIINSKNDEFTKSKIIPKCELKMTPVRNEKIDLFTEIKPKKTDTKNINSPKITEIIPSKESIKQKHDTSKINESIREEFDSLKLKETLNEKLDGQYKIPTQLRNKEKNEDKTEKPLQTYSKKSTFIRRIHKVFDDKTFFKKYSKHSTTIKIVKQEMKNSQSENKPDIKKPLVTNKKTKQSNITKEDQNINIANDAEKPLSESLNIDLNTEKITKDKINNDLNFDIQKGTSKCPQKYKNEKEIRFNLIGDIESFENKLKSENTLLEDIQKNNIKDFSEVHINKKQINVENIKENIENHEKITKSLSEDLSLPFTVIEIDNKPKKNIEMIVTDKENNINNKVITNVEIISELACQKSLADVTEKAENKNLPNNNITVNKIDSVFVETPTDINMTVGMNKNVNLSLKNSSESPLQSHSAVIKEISEPQTTTVIKEKTDEQTECVPNNMAITKDNIDVLPEFESKTVTTIINNKNDELTKIDIIRQCEPHSTAVRNCTREILDTKLNDIIHITVKEKQSNKNDVTSENETESGLELPQEKAEKNVCLLNTCNFNHIDKLDFKVDFNESEVTGAGKIVVVEKDDYNSIEDLKIDHSRDDLNIVNNEQEKLPVNLLSDKTLESSKTDIIEITGTEKHFIAEKSNYNSIEDLKIDHSIDDLNIVNNEQKKLPVNLLTDKTLESGKTDIIKITGTEKHFIAEKSNYNSIEDLKIDHSIDDLNIVNNEQEKLPVNLLTDKTLESGKTDIIEITGTEKHFIAEKSNYNSIEDLKIDHSIDDLNIVNNEQEKLPVNLLTDKTLESGKTDIIEIPGTEKHFIAEKSNYNSIEELNIDHSIEDFNIVNNEPVNLLTDKILEFSKISAKMNDNVKNTENLSENNINLTKISPKLETETVSSVSLNQIDKTSTIITSPSKIITQSVKENKLVDKKIEISQENNSPQKSKSSKYTENAEISKTNVYNMDSLDNKSSDKDILIGIQNSNPLDQSSELVTEIENSSEELESSNKSLSTKKSDLIETEIVNFLDNSQKLSNSISETIVLKNNLGPEKEIVTDVENIVSPEQQCQNLVDHNKKLPKLIENPENEVDLNLENISKNECIEELTPKIKIKNEHHYLNKDELVESIKIQPKIILETFDEKLDVPLTSDKRLQQDYLNYKNTPFKLRIKRRFSQCANKNETFESETLTKSNNLFNSTNENEMMSSLLDRIDEIQNEKDETYEIKTNKTEIASKINDSENPLEENCNKIIMNNQYSLKGKNSGKIRCKDFASKNINETGEYNILEKKEHWMKYIGLEKNSLTTVNANHKAPSDMVKKKICGRRKKSRCIKRLSSIDETNDPFHAVTNNFELLLVAAELVCDDKIINENNLCQNVSSKKVGRPPKKFQSIEDNKRKKKNNQILSERSTRSTSLLKEEIEPKSIIFTKQNKSLNQLTASIDQSTTDKQEQLVNASLKFNHIKELQISERSKRSSSLQKEEIETSVSNDLIFTKPRKASICNRNRLINNNQSKKIVRFQTPGSDEILYPEKSLQFIDSADNTEIVNSVNKSKKGRKKFTKDNLHIDLIKPNKSKQKSIESSCINDNNNILQNLSILNSVAQSPTSNSTDSDDFEKLVIDIPEKTVSKIISGPMKSHKEKRKQSLNNLLDTNESKPIPQKSKKQEKCILPPPVINYDDALLLVSNGTPCQKVYEEVEAKLMEENNEQQLLKKHFTPAKMCLNSKLLNSPNNQKFNKTKSLTSPGILHLTPEVDIISLYGNKKSEILESTETDRSENKMSIIKMSPAKYNTICDEPPDEYQIMYPIVELSETDDVLNIGDFECSVKSFNDCKKTNLNRTRLIQNISNSNIDNNFRDNNLLKVKQKSNDSNISKGHINKSNENLVTPNKKSINNKVSRNQRKLSTDRKKCIDSTEKVTDFNKTVEQNLTNNIITPKMRIIPYSPKYNEDLKNISSLNEKLTKTSLNIKATKSENKSSFNKLTTSKVQQEVEIKKLDMENVVGIEHVDENVTSLNENKKLIVGFSDLKLKTIQLTALEDNATDNKISVNNTDVQVIQNQKMENNLNDELIINAPVIQQLFSDRKLDIKTDATILSDKKLDSKTEQLLLDKKLDAKIDAKILSDKKLDSKTEQLLSVKKLDAKTDATSLPDKKLDSKTEQLLLDKKLDAKIDAKILSDKKLDSKTEQLLSVKKLDAKTDATSLPDKKLDSKTGYLLSDSKLDTKTDAAPLSDKKLESKTKQLLDSKTEQLLSVTKLDTKTDATSLSDKKLDSKTEQLLSDRKFDTKIDAKTLSDIKLDSKTEQLLSVKKLDAKTDATSLPDKKLDSKTGYLLSDSKLDTKTDAAPLSDKKLESKTKQLLDSKTEQLLSVTKLDTKTDATSLSDKKLDSTTEQLLSDRKIDTKIDVKTLSDKQMNSTTEQQVSVRKLDTKIDAKRLSANKMDSKTKKLLSVRNLDTTTDATALSDKKLDSKTEQQLSVRKFDTKTNATPLSDKNLDSKKEQLLSVRKFDTKTNATPLSDKKLESKTKQLLLVTKLDTKADATPLADKILESKTKQLLDSKTEQLLSVTKLDTKTDATPLSDKKLDSTTEQLLSDRKIDIKIDSKTLSDKKMDSTSEQLLSVRKLNTKTEQLLSNKQFLDTKIDAKPLSDKKLDSKTEQLLSDIKLDSKAKTLSDRKLDTKSDNFKTRSNSEKLKDGNNIIKMITENSELSISNTPIISKPNQKSQLKLGKDINSISNKLLEIASHEEANLKSNLDKTSYLKATTTNNNVNTGIESIISKNQSKVEINKLRKKSIEQPSAIQENAVKKNSSIDNPLRINRENLILKQTIKPTQLNLTIQPIALIKVQNIFNDNLKPNLESESILGKVDKINSESILGNVDNNISNLPQNEKTDLKLKQNKKKSEIKPVQNLELLKVSKLDKDKMNNTKSLDNSITNTKQSVVDQLKSTSQLNSTISNESQIDIKEKEFDVVENKTTNEKLNNLKISSLIQNISDIEKHPTYQTVTSKDFDKKLSLVESQNIAPSTAVKPLASNKQLKTNQKKFTIKSSRRQSTKTSSCLEKIKLERNAKSDKNKFSPKSVNLKSCFVDLSTFLHDPILKNKLDELHNIENRNCGKLLDENVINKKKEEKCIEINLTSPQTKSSSNIRKTDHITKEQSEKSDFCENSIEKFKKTSKESIIRNYENKENCKSIETVKSTDSLQIESKKLENDKYSIQNKISKNEQENLNIVKGKLIVQINTDNTTMSDNTEEFLKIDNAKCTSKPSEIPLNSNNFENKLTTEIVNLNQKDSEIEENLLDSNLLPIESNEIETGKALQTLSSMISKIEVDLDENLNNKKLEDDKSSKSAESTNNEKSIFESQNTEKHINLNLNNNKVENKTNEIALKEDEEIHPAISNIENNLVNTKSIESSVFGEPSNFISPFSFCNEMPKNIFDGGSDNSSSSEYNKIPIEEIIESYQLNTKLVEEEKCIKNELNKCQTTNTKRKRKHRRSLSNKKSRSENITTEELQTIAQTKKCFIKLKRYKTVEELEQEQIKRLKLESNIENDNEMSNIKYNNSTNNLSSISANSSPTTISSYESDSSDTSSNIESTILNVKMQLDNLKDLRFSTTDNVTDHSLQDISQINDAIINTSFKNSVDEINFNDYNNSIEDMNLISFSFNTSDWCSDTILESITKDLDGDPEYSKNNKGDCMISGKVPVPEQSLNLDDIICPLMDSDITNLVPLEAVNMNLILNESVISSKQQQQEILDNNLVESIINPDDLLNQFSTDVGFDFLAHDNTVCDFGLLNNTNILSMNSKNSIGNTNTILTIPNDSLVNNNLNSNNIIHSTPKKYNESTNKKLNNNDTINISPVSMPIDGFIKKTIFDNKNDKTKKFVEEFDIPEKDLAEASSSKTKLDNLIEDSIVNSGKEIHINDLINNKSIEKQINVEKISDKNESTTIKSATDQLNPTKNSTKPEDKSISDSTTSYVKSISNRRKSIAELIAEISANNQKTPEKYQTSKTPESKSKSYPTPFWKKKKDELQSPPVEKDSEEISTLLNPTTSSLTTSSNVQTLPILTKSIDTLKPVSADLPIKLADSTVDLKNPICEKSIKQTVNVIPNCTKVNVMIISPSTISVTSTAPTVTTTKSNLYHMPVLEVPTTTNDSFKKTKHIQPLMKPLIKSPNVTAIPKNLPQFNAGIITTNDVKLNEAKQKVVTDFIPVVKKSIQQIQSSSVNNIKRCNIETNSSDIPLKRKFTGYVECSTPVDIFDQIKNEPPINNVQIKLDQFKNEKNIPNTVQKNISSSIVMPVKKSPSVVQKSSTQLNSIPNPNIITKNISNNIYKTTKNNLIESPTSKTPINSPLEKSPIISSRSGQGQQSKHELDKVKYNNNTGFNQYSYRNPNLNQHFIPSPTIKTINNSPTISTTITTENQQQIKRDKSSTSQMYNNNNSTTNSFKNSISGKQNFTPSPTTTSIKTPTKYSPKNLNKIEYQTNKNHISNIEKPNTNLIASVNQQKQSILNRIAEIEVTIKNFPVPQNYRQHKQLNELKGQLNELKTELDTKILAEKQQQNLLESRQKIHHQQQKQQYKQYSQSYNNNSTNSSLKSKSSSTKRENIYLFSKINPSSVKPLSKLIDTNKIQKQPPTQAPWEYRQLSGDALIAEILAKQNK